MPATAAHPPRPAPSPPQAQLPATPPATHANTRAAAAESPPYSAPAPPAPQPQSVPLPGAHRQKVARYASSPSRMYLPLSSRERGAAPQRGGVRSLHAGIIRKLGNGFFAPPRMTGGGTASPIAIYSAQPHTLPSQGRVAVPQHGGERSKEVTTRSRTHPAAGPPRP